MLDAFSNPLAFVVGLVAIVASFTLHEFSHALAGTLQGDDTAQRMGRLTLNPLAHIDPIGFLAMITVGFGWGKPVPFNPYNLKNQKWGPTLVAVAGPGANVVLLVLSALVLRAVVGAGLPSDNTLVFFLSVMITFNAALFIFNLIPVPPLDGSKFLLSVLSGPEHARARFWLESRGPLLLIGLIIVDSFVLHGLLFGSLFQFVTGGIFRLFGLGGLF